VYGIGLIGRPPVQVDATTYDLWKAAPRLPNLAQATQCFRATPDPLTATLRQIQVLLALGVAYVDVCPEA
jgi:hypothetical protein